MQQLHTFRIGDQVELVHSQSNVPRGPYKITGLMPEGRDGQPQYRIRSDGGGTERVVTQPEIARRQSSTFHA